ERSQQFPPTSKEWIGAVDYEPAHLKRGEKEFHHCECIVSSSRRPAILIFHVTRWRDRMVLQNLRIHQDGECGGPMGFSNHFHRQEGNRGRREQSWRDTLGPN